MIRGTVYKLSFTDDDHWAIGSTTQSLGERKTKYYNSAQSGHGKTLLYQKILQVGKGGFQLTPLEVVEVADVKQLRMLENSTMADHLDEFCLNSRRAYCTREDRNADDRRRRRTEEGQAKISDYHCTKSFKDSQRKWKAKRRAEMTQSEKDLENEKQKRRYQARKSATVQPT